MEIDSLVYVLVIMYPCIHYVLFVYVRMCIYINFLIAVTKHLTYTSYRMELTLDPTVRGCSSPWWAEQLTPAGRVGGSGSGRAGSAARKHSCESCTMVPGKTEGENAFSASPPLFLYSSQGPSLSKGSMHIEGSASS